MTLRPLPALTLACILAAGILAGCGGGSKDQGSSGEAPLAGTPPPADPVISAPTLALTGQSYQAMVSATSGATYTWTVTGDGSLASGQGTSSIQFTTGSNPGSLTLKCDVVSTGKTKTAATSVQVVSSSSTVSYYGTGIGASALGNTRVGGPTNLVCAYRFRAQGTQLTGIRIFVIWDPKDSGYSGGTGGIVRASIYADDPTTHFPAGNPLASVSYPNPIAQGNYWPRLVFPAPVSLVKDALYHVVFTNPDANRSENYYSINALYRSTYTVPNQPTIADLDCAMELGGSSDGGANPNGNWSLRNDHNTTSYTPIAAYDYADGPTHGFGYMEVWVGNPKTISGSSQVRETFTVSGGNRKVSQVAVRLKRSSGASPLTIRLEKADGTLVEQGTVDASQSGSFYGWVSLPLATQPTLLNGQGYHLVLSAPSDTVYQAYPIRDGSDQHFPAPTVFPDGWAEFSTGSGFTGWDQWGQPNRKDGDLQFYFVGLQ